MLDIFLDFLYWLTGSNAFQGKMGFPEQQEGETKVTKQASIWTTGHWPMSLMHMSVFVFLLTANEVYQVIATTVQKYSNIIVCITFSSTAILHTVWVVSDAL